MASLLHTASPKFFEPDYPGGLLHTYAAGTTTNKATYSDPNERTDSQNANPVVLDSAGRATIYGSGLYSFVFKDSAGTTVWSQDNIRILALSNFALTVLDDTSAAAVRSTLGLGAAAVLGATQNTSNNVVVWNTSNNYPAGNGSAITNVAAANVTGWYWPRGYLSGFKLSNSGSTLTLNVAVGTCRDSTNAKNITLSSALSKVLQSSGSWTQGTGQNGLDTGAVAGKTWYHVYVILDNNDANADILFSTSASSPTMPTGYTTGVFRRIGSVKTNSPVTQIDLFNQYADDFMYYSPVVNVNNVTVDASELTMTLSTVPSGFNFKAYITTQFNDADGIYIYDLGADGSTVPSWGAGSLTAPLAMLVSYSTETIAAPMEVWTNTSQQIGAISASASNKIWISVRGYQDRRGRDD